MQHILSGFNCCRFALITLPRTFFAASVASVLEMRYGGFGC